MKKLFEWWLLISPLNLKAEPAGGTTNNYGNKCIFLGNDLGLVPSKEYKAGKMFYVTRELPGVALVNFSNEYTFMGNSNTFILGQGK